MSAYLTFPFTFLKFWFVEAPYEIMAYFVSFNKAFMQLFSLPLLLRTFFKPLKNEYRQGLVGFSIVIGIFIKTWVIMVDIFLLIVLLAIEGLLLFAFLLWPVLTVWILF